MCCVTSVCVSKNLDLFFYINLRVSCKPVRTGIHFEQTERVFYLTTLSVVRLYSAASVLGTTTNHWWDDNDRGKPKYAEEDLSTKNSTLRAEPVTVRRTCPFLVRYTLILLVRVESKQMCVPHPFATTGSFPVFRAVHT